MLQMILYFCLAVTYTLASRSGVNHHSPFAEWAICVKMCSSCLLRELPVCSGSSNVIQRGLSFHPPRAALLLRTRGIKPSVCCSVAPCCSTKMMFREAY